MEETVEGDDQRGIHHIPVRADIEYGAAVAEPRVLVHATGIGVADRALELVHGAVHIRPADGFRHSLDALVRPPVAVSVGVHRLLVFSLNFGNGVGVAP